MSESRADENAQLVPDDAMRQHDMNVPDDSASPAHPAAEPPRSAQRNIAAILGAVLVVVLVLVLAAPYWAPAVIPLLPWGEMLNSRLLEERIAALESRPTPEAGGFQAALEKTNRVVAGLDERVGVLEQRSAQLSTPPATADLGPLRDEISQQQQALHALEDRVNGLATNIEQRPAGDPVAVQELRAATGKLGAALADLDARLGKLAASEASDSRQDQALLLGLGQLRQALLGSAPFTADLAAATALAHDRPEVLAALSPLSADAARGIPSLAILQQRFASSAGAIANAGTAPPAAADDWGSAALAKLRGLVTVRRVGSAAVVAGGPQAAVATAEDALAAGDLAGAVASLETLTGEAAAAAKPWLDDARHRLAAEAALDKATGIVTARLGGHSASVDDVGRR
jgi:hypothetical protein